MNQEVKNRKTFDRHKWGVLDSRRKRPVNGDFIPSFDFSHLENLAEIASTLKGSTIPTQKQLEDFNFKLLSTGRLLLDSRKTDIYGPYLKGKPNTYSNNGVSDSDIGCAQKRINTSPQYMTMSIDNMFPHECATARSEQRFKSRAVTSTSQMKLVAGALLEGYEYYDITSVNGMKNPSQHQNSISYDTWSTSATSQNSIQDEAREFLHSLQEHFGHRYDNIARSFVDSLKRFLCEELSEMALMAVVKIMLSDAPHLLLKFGDFIAISNDPEDGLETECVNDEERGELESDGRDQSVAFSYDDTAERESAQQVLHLIRSCMSTANYQKFLDVMLEARTLYRTGLYQQFNERLSTAKSFIPSSRHELFNLFDESFPSTTEADNSWQDRERSTSGDHSTSAAQLHQEQLHGHQKTAISKSLQRDLLMPVERARIPPMNSIVEQELFGKISIPSHALQWSALRVPGLPQATPQSGFVQKLSSFNNFNVMAPIGNTDSKAQALPFHHG